MPSIYAERVQRYGHHWHRPWLAMLAALGVTALVMEVTVRRDVIDIAGRKLVQKEIRVETFEHIRKAPRAIVYVGGINSVYAEGGRRRFEEDAKELAADPRLPDTAFFSLYDNNDHRDEKTLSLNEWLSSFTRKGSEDWPYWETARGIGGCFWFANGRLVHEAYFFREPSHYPSVYLETRRLWGGGLRP